MKDLPVIPDGDVSPAFVRYMNAAMARMPAKLRADLAESGWEIKLLPKAGRIFTPSSRVSASFASASGTSHERLSGATCMDGSHVVAFFESCLDKNGRVKSGPDAWLGDDQIMHEMGHALDRNRRERSGMAVSDMPEFITAYKTDIRGMSAQERDFYAYFLPDSPKSREQQKYARREVVAESFSQILLGGPREAPPPVSPQSLAGLCMSIFQTPGSLRPFDEVFARSMAVVDKTLAHRYKRQPDFIKDWASKAHLKYL